MSSAISCLDTRYFNDIKELINVFDDFAYYRNRIYVEIKYFELFTSANITYNPFTDFSYNDYLEILKNEELLRHDVKAIEYFIKDIPEIKNTENAHLIHIGLTSQDVNSIGFMLCFRDSSFIILDTLKNLINKFTEQLITPYLDTINKIQMLSYTHGQPATPTDFAKEMLIYKTRLDNIYNEMNEFITSGLTVKFGGATGNMNALNFALPDINWSTWADHFITLFNINTQNTQNTPSSHFKRTQYTNQCDNYDSVINFLYMLKRMLHILEHLRGNLWLYIHREYFIQKNVKIEIGSSTMPNKINPIDLENVKTSIEIAKRMIDGICDILTETSYQRDISDSSALRNVSSIFGYVLITLKKMTSGISRLLPDIKKIEDELSTHPEVILEGIQTYLKIHCNIENSYEIIKDMTRGKKISILDIYCIIDLLDIDEIHKMILHNLTPNNYK
jgi:adenylosuccinate lyase